MKNYKSILSIVLLGTLTTALTGCRDDLKDPNIPPSEVTDASASQLFTTAQLGFSPFDYGVWFHTADNYLKNCQMCGFSGSMTEDRLAKSGQTLGLMSTELLRYYNEMVDKFGEDGGDNACYLKAVQVLAIFGGIRDTDNNGDIPYTEAASYIYGGPMTPKYDKVQELYTLWNSQLKAAVQVFKNPPSPKAVMKTIRILPTNVIGASGPNLQAPSVSNSQPALSIVILRLQKLLSPRLLLMV